MGLRERHLISYAPDWRDSCDGAVRIRRGEVDWKMADAEPALYPGDRVRYLRENTAFGTVLTEPSGDEVAVRLDDGRAIRVHVRELARLGHWSIRSAGG